MAQEDLIVQAARPRRVRLRHRRRLHPTGRCDLRGGVGRRARDDTGTGDRLCPRKQRRRLFSVHLNRFINKVIGPLLVLGHTSYWPDTPVV
jgi:hypothetical protein